MRFQHTRHIPPNAVPVTEDESLGVCYVYPIIARNSWGVIAYVGKSNKARFHYSYRRESDMDKRIADFFAGLRAHREYVAKSRQETSAVGRQCPACLSEHIKPRWANQTDSGQNRLGPSPTRAMDRARTYPGPAAAMAKQWGGLSV